MTQSILTPTAVTREALRILHQKLNFIGNIDRQYDSQFANEGAKIGSQLKVRLPNEYTVRTGAAINVQDTTEISETITMATQKGVDVGAILGSRCGHDEALLGAHGVDRTGIAAR